jgi:hypothetical protein
VIATGDVPDHERAPVALYLIRNFGRFIGRAISMRLTFHGSRIPAIFDQGTLGQDARISGGTILIASPMISRLRTRASTVSCPVKKQVGQAGIVVQASRLHFLVCRRDGCTTIGQAISLRAVRLSRELLFVHPGRISVDPFDGFENVVERNVIVPWKTQARHTAVPMISCFRWLLTMTKTVVRIFD